MLNINMKKILISALTLLIALFCICSCENRKQKKYNTANLELDLGIGFSHFDNESDYPAPSMDAVLDVYASKIIIKNAYGDKIIETPLIYNNSSTAYPRMKLKISGNRMYVIYCPDISLPGLQIASTDDGGSSWIQSTIDLSGDSVSIIDEFFASFWSTRNGELTVYDASSGNTLIYFTDDAGKTWDKTASAPPISDWHNSLYKSIFLSSTIGFATYNYYTYPPNEPQVYYTLDGSESWSKLPIKVPDSVMTAYSLAGEPFYDGEKINIPIELYDENDVKTDEKYYVSYDFGETWKFFAEEGETLNIIRNAESEKWFAENRPEILSELSYFVTDFSLYSSFNIEENVRIDAYKFVTAYNVEDWKNIKLTGNMYFDADANLYYKSASGFPILLFVYEGDVFKHTYSLLGSSTESDYKNEGEEHLSKRLYEEYSEQRALKELYVAASEAYALFTGYASITYTGESLDYEGQKYDRVDLGEITSVELLAEHLSTLFSQEIAERLLEATVSVGNTEFPLYINGEDGLYRFGGYAAMFGANDIVPELTVTEMTASRATVTMSVSKEFYGTLIEFTEDCNAYIDTDGLWKFETFTLAAEKAWKIHTGNDTEDKIDKTEVSITDISKWEKLSYSGVGSEQIRRFLKALIEGDTVTASELTSASSKEVFEKYADIKISSYTVSKIYEGGQSKIRFEYVIDETPNEAVERASVGSHSLMVNAVNGCVYLTKPKSEKSEAEKFIHDYFTATLKTYLTDLTELRYNELIDITDFLIRRSGKSKATKNEISDLAYIIFGADSFTPAESLRDDNGLYSSPQRNSRGLEYDVINEEVSGEKVSLTVQLYADRSRLVGAGIIKCDLERNSTNFKITNIYTRDPSPFTVYKTASAE